jgi:hypothetical protein
MGTAPRVFRRPWRRKRERRWTLAEASLAAVGLALMFFLFFRPNPFLLLRSDELVATTATVQHAWSEPARRQRGYVVYIDYAYEVDGRRYEGRRYSPASPHERVYGLDEQTRMLGEHKIGTAITVYYDPRNPGRSARTRDTEGWFERAALPAFFLSLGAGLGLASLFTRRHFGLRRGSDLGRGG